jgi:tRNA dimethylallyltransferase
MKKYDLIAILGPTASGKTTLAAHLAAKLHTEIISADSRQVYRRMDLGTGKDLADYEVEGQPIPYHLIDIAEPGTKYNVFQYQQDFLRAYKDIADKGKLPIVCGGSGLYIESILRGYRMEDVRENKALRQQLEGKSLEELTEILKTYKTLHNTVQTDTAKRAIRAIEIADFYEQHGISQTAEGNQPLYHPLVIGVKIDRELRREKISRRLRQRLDEGMVEEVKGLLAEGIAAEDLIYYGLEYKFLTLYVTGQLSYEEMVSQLEIAIHQFAKRQMTWFRGMERRGVKIHWIEATLPMEEKIKTIMDLYIQL